jgi:hypothetical protein
MQFILGVLLAVALTATSISLGLAALFGDYPIFAALGQSLAVLGAAAFAWWLWR